MDGLLGFLGIARDVAWVYLIAVFLAATGLFFFDRRPKKAASEDTAQTHEKAA